jgi:hypothetical protein
LAGRCGTEHNQIVYSVNKIAVADLSDGIHQAANLLPSGTTRIRFPGLGDSKTAGLKYPAAERGGKDLFI